MKKTEQIIEGVAAEYNGEYWGRQEYDVYDYGPIERAIISDPEYCKKPTDNTYGPGISNPNPHYEKLQKAKLVRVRRTIVQTFEVIE